MLIYYLLGKYKRFIVGTLKKDEIEKYKSIIASGS